ncbi:MAG: GNAT family N-acetyltransferase [Arachnia propionica]|uniref:GNAT family N-acetyltransferase n=1 Tax=Arachnia propionica TaxID=1750 RepID=UPI0026F614D9|nr:GNAT family N-acetyltransferase [Arachnia propionica]
MTIRVRPFRELSTDELYEIAQLRELVFHLEQRITVADLDDLDRARDTRHWWVAGPAGIVAYARSVRLATPEHGAVASFGRVAVRADRRGEGLAAGLVTAILEQFRDEPVVIHSQRDVVGLYERFGFRAVGEEFLEAGIPHRSMIRPV